MHRPLIRIVSLQTGQRRLRHLPIATRLAVPCVSFPLLSLISGEALDVVEQCCFANSSQTRQQHALLRSFLFDSAQKNARLLENGVSSYQFGRRRTGSRREGILDGVHFSTYTRLY